MARLIVGNWKMNLTRDESTTLVERLGGKVKPSERVEVVLCPPFVHLPLVAEAAAGTGLALGAQTLHHLDHGPFTGEISGSQIAEYASYVIVGHSERRAMGETDKQVAQKLAAAIRNGLTPILCIGENLHEREAGLSKKVVLDQLTGGLGLLTAAEVTDIVVAYEPVWAISHGDGKGKHALPDDVRPVVAAIRGAIEDLYGEAGGIGVRVLYGGSVNADDCSAYLGLSGIDGLLVGGDSLIYEDFAKIVAVADRPVD